VGASDPAGRGAEAGVNWKVTRLPILACSRLHVYIGAIAKGLQELLSLNSLISKYNTTISKETLANSTTNIQALLHTISG
jgi:hypothetical protein